MPVSCRLPATAGRWCRLNVAVVNGKAGFSHNYQGINVRRARDAIALFVFGHRLDDGARAGSPTSRASVNLCLALFLVYRQIIPSVPSGYVVLCAPRKKRSMRAALRDRNRCDPFADVDQPPAARARYGNLVRKVV